MAMQPRCSNGLVVALAIWSAFMTASRSNAEGEATAEIVVAPAPVGSAPSSETAIVGPFEAQCGAVRASALGNLLDAKRSAVPCPRRGIRARSAKDAHVRRVTLALAAEEARNNDAGAALQLYWALAEAEHSLPIVDAARAAAELSLADQATLTKRGVDTPLDDALLQGRRLALDDARITVAAAIDSLSIGLSQLAALPGPVIKTMPPSTDHDAIGEPLDADALVAEGLERRPQLRLLRFMIAHLDEDTVEVGSTVLSLAAPGLGNGSQPAPRCAALCGLRSCHRRSAETVGIGRELRQLLVDRESAVESEIRQAVTLTVAAADRVRTAKRQLELTKQSAADKRARQTVAEADAFAVHVADLEVNTAQRTVVERLAEWERSRAKIWLAQGVLAVSCAGGGRPPLTAARRQPAAAALQMRN
jgi:hypothetical protein